MMLHKDTPKLLYSAKTNGIIWKIEVDDQSGIMVWETRYPDRSISFSAYDFLNQNSLLVDENLNREQSSLSFISKRLIFFQLQESESLPIFKGIISFNILTKEIQWENYAIALQQHFKEGIVVFNPRIFPRSFELLNETNGQTIKKIHSNEFSTLTPIHRHILLPETIQTSSQHHVVNQLYHKGITIKSELEKEEGFLKNSISVIRNNELLFKDYLNSDIQKPAFDTFFVWQDRLVYIKNKSEIVTYLV